MHDPTSWPELVLAVAPNGARTGPWDHPAVPLTPADLATTASQCLAAGAALIHLHVRDDEGSHSLDVNRYREAIGAVRAAVGDEMVIQVTTESAGRYARAEQMQLVRDLQPEAVSLALGELVPDAAAEHEAREFFTWLARQPIQPQLILYSAAELDRYRALRNGGVIPEMRHSLLFVLGRYTESRVAQPLELVAFLERLEPGTPWMTCAFGPLEQACGVAAAALGGHVRVGFENNLRLIDGSTAPDNAALVRQMADAARTLGRPLATADRVRAIFGTGAAELR